MLLDWLRWHSAALTGPYARRPRSDEVVEEHAANGGGDHGEQPGQDALRTDPNERGEQPDPERPDCAASEPVDPTHPPHLPSAATRIVRTGAWFQVAYGSEALGDRQGAIEGYHLALELLVPEPYASYAREALNRMGEWSPM